MDDAGTEPLHLTRIEHPVYLRAMQRRINERHTTVTREAQLLRVSTTDLRTRMAAGFPIADGVEDGPLFLPRRAATTPRTYTRMPPPVIDEETLAASYARYRKGETTPIEEGHRLGLRDIDLVEAWRGRGWQILTLAERLEERRQVKAKKHEGR